VTTAKGQDGMAGVWTDDVLGWHRVDESYEVTLIESRLSICDSHYNFNGPPPYELMKDTVPLGPGWRYI
jgi:hypothetical protein